MTKKEKIINFYYEKRLNTIDISKKLKVSKQYVSKIIKTDMRYDSEKLKRKQETKIRHNKKNIECISRKRKQNKNEQLDATLEILHKQASFELSSKKIINNRAFKNWNSSIFEYYSKTREFRLLEEFNNKTSYAVPKKIKCD